MHAHEHLPRSAQGNGDHLNARLAPGSLAAGRGISPRKLTCAWKGCGATFTVVTKFEPTAKFCEKHRRARSDYGRMDGFGQRHTGFNGPGRKKA